MRQEKFLSDLSSKINSTKQSLGDLLSRTDIKEIELSAGPLKIHLEWSDVLSLKDSQDVIGDILTHHFIRRRVMWVNPSEEIPISCIYSLKEAEKELDKCAKKLRKSKKGRALAQIVTMWATACALSHKELMGERERLSETSDVYSAIENRDVLLIDATFNERPRNLSNNLYRALVRLRITAYPLIYSLIEFLPEEDPIKQQALVIWEKYKNVEDPWEWEDPLRYKYRHYASTEMKDLKPEWHFSKSNLIER